MKAKVTRSTYIWLENLVEEFNKGKERKSTRFYKDESGVKNQGKEDKRDCKW